MSAEELNEFLVGQRTCRVATVGADGRPHNSPLWFVWDGAALWLNSIVMSQRWTDIARNPNVSIVIDAGHDYTELRGVEMIGELRPAGDVPRGTAPRDELDEPERLFGTKYNNGTFYSDGRHAWLRLDPTKVVSWDFRKIATRKHTV